MVLLYQRILSEFPQIGLRSAFAYGSYVYKQLGQALGANNMIDFIFIVDNPFIWHRENYLIHRKHYAFAYKIYNRFPNSFPDVYFNTLIEMENHTIKYGVISTKSFTSDLKHWNQLYISGRLHKPVVWIKETINESDVLESTDIELSKYKKQNLEQAVAVALLLLPETFSESELFIKICGLSYNGDFRMIFGEDKNKVRRIVWGHENDFRRLYGPILSEIPQVDWKSAYSDLLMRDCSIEGQKLLAKRIPTNLLKSIRSKYKKDTVKFESDLCLIDWIVEQPTHILENALSSIVAKSSIRQSIGNFFTAGFWKSLVYSSKKLRKMFNSKNI